ncbi:MAG: T9SS type A sorting domain-containing protein [Chryseolinea sp.]
MQTLFLLFTLTTARLTAQDRIQHGPNEVFLARDIIEDRNGRLYLSTSGGLYYSDNAGDEWHLVDHYLNSVDLEPLMTIDKRTGALYLADNHDILHSTDNAKNFTVTTYTFPVGDVGTQSFAVDGDTLWVGTNRGLLYFLSNESPTKYHSIDALKDKGVISLYVDDRDIIAATNDSGLYLSRNGGIDWSPINNGLPAVFYARGLHIQEPEDIWYTYGSEGLFISTNHGASWQPKGNGMTEFFIFDIAVKGNEIYAVSDTDDALWHLAEGSDTWQLIEDFSPARSNLWCVWAKGDEVIVGGYRGLYKKKSPAEAFVQSNKGITDAFAVTTLNQASDGTIWATASKTGIYSMAPGETMFTPFEQNNEGYGDTPLLHDSLVITSNHIVRFYDVIGHQWLGEIPCANVPFVRTFVKASGDMYLSDEEYGIFKYNGTDTWQTFNDGLADLRIVKMQAHRGRLYAATREGFYSRGHADAEWKRIAFDSLRNNVGVNTFYIADDIMIISGLNSRCYSSANDGSTWRRIASLTGMKVSAFTSHNARIYAAGVSDLFVSEDKSSWKPAALAPTEAVSLLAANDRIYVGTIRRGIWSVPESRFFRIDQSIDISKIPTDVNLGEPVTLEATATSGLPVTFTVFNGPAELSGNILTIKGDARVTIEASVEGNDAYSPARKLIVFEPGNITATEDFNAESIAIYPVPASSILHVSGASSARLSMIDVHGRILLTQEINGETEVDISRLSPGVYVLMIADTLGVVARRKVIRN